MGTKDPITIAVDAMGGYHAPEEVVSAVAEASLRRGKDSSVYFALVGDEIALTEALFERDQLARIGLVSGRDVWDLARRCLHVLGYRPTEPAKRFASLAASA